MYDTTKPYINQVVQLMKQTWETPYVSANGVIVKKKFSYPECRPHTDGIGTKGDYHWQQRTFRNAVLDALAMNLNDLALYRATPYAITDHVLLPEDDKDAVLEITQYLTEECRKRYIAVMGGETAVHDNMKGLEISITMMGFVKRPKSNHFRIGDVLIGIRSSGLHSNGFTKVREVFGKENRDEFVLPTEIYLDKILELDEKFDIHGMSHITGGAYHKLKGLLHNADARIRRSRRLQPHEVFLELYGRGVSDEEMYRTFNCGIGFVLSVYPRDADEIVSELDADVIGEVIPGTRKVKIESMFSGKQIEF